MTMKINSTETCCANRKGWDKKEMNLTKKDDNHRAYKFMVDTDNNVLCCQWVDSKVVNCVSSIMTTEIAKVKPPNVAATNWSLTVHEYK
jgi:hypothetical protein